MWRFSDANESKFSVDFGKCRNAPSLQANLCSFELLFCSNVRRASGKCEFGRILIAVEREELQTS